MEVKELYLKTLFCCSACDGEIAPEEMSLVKQISENDRAFDGVDVEGVLNQYVEQINNKGRAFLQEYLREVADTNLSDSESLKLIELAVKMIEADQQVLYSEVKFFRTIRSNLRISDSEILKALPEVEDYLLPDVMVDSKEVDWSGISFAPISFSL